MILQNESSDHSPAATASQQDLGRRFLPNKVAAWFVGVLLLPVVPNWFTNPTSPLPPVLRYAFAVVLVILIVLTFPRGFLHRDQYGTSPLGRAVAGLLFVAYVTGAPWLMGSDSLLLGIGGIVLIWAATVAMTWSTLHNQLPKLHVMLGYALLLGGVALVQIGATAPNFASWRGRGVVLLFGVGLGLQGVACLSTGRERAGEKAVLLFALGWLPYGGAFVLFGIAALQSGYLLAGGAALLFGAGFLLVGVALWRSEIRLVGVAVILVGVGMGVIAVAGLGRGDTSEEGGDLWSVALLLLLLLEVILLAVGLLRSGFHLAQGNWFKSAVVVAGAMILASGVAAWRHYGAGLLGIAGILAGIAGILAGCMMLWGTGQVPWQSVWFWLTKHDPEAHQQPKNIAEH